MGTFNVNMPQNNGEKTIYITVYDGSGNASVVMKATVTLVDQKTEVAGLLNDENLTWTKDKSPYLVTGSVYVSEGDTLTIEPGVDVQFAGPYSIHVVGRILAQGTEKEHIKFYGIDKGYNTWEGINVQNNDLRSHLNYVDVYDGNTGLVGYVVAENSIINVQNHALGNSLDDPFKGFLYRVDSRGEVCLDGALLDNVIIKGNSERIANSIVFNTLFEGDIDETSNGNNFIYCTFEKDVFFSGVGGIDFINYCYFENVPLVIIGDGSNVPGVISIKYSNLINGGKISVNTRSSNAAILDFQNNFWGYDKTREMDENKNGNVSFIDDFFDNNFTVSRVDYSNYYREPLQNVGYQGDSFTLANIPGRIYEVGGVGELGGTILYYDENNEFGWDYIEGITLQIMLPFGYYRDSPIGVNKMVGTSAEIGAGKVNTEKLVEAMGDSAYLEESGNKKGMYAAKFVSIVDIVGDNWYLPSSGENKLFKNTYGWSSTEIDANHVYNGNGLLVDWKFNNNNINLVHYF